MQGEERLHSSRPMSIRAQPDDAQVRAEGRRAGMWKMGRGSGGAARGSLIHMDAGERDHAPIQRWFVWRVRTRCQMFPADLYVTVLFGT